MKQLPKKRRLSYEPEKVRRTAHWDWDYMPLDEMEKRYAQHAEKSGRRREKGPKKAFWTQSKIAVACILGGLALILLSVTIAGTLTPG